MTGRAAAAAEPVGAGRDRVSHRQACTYHQADQPAWTSHLEDPQHDSKRHRNHGDREQNHHSTINSTTRPEYDRKTEKTVAETKNPSGQRTKGESAATFSPPPGAYALDGDNA